MRESELRACLPGVCYFFLSSTHILHFLYALLPCCNFAHDSCAFQVYQCFGPPSPPVHEGRSVTLFFVPSKSDFLFGKQFDRSGIALRLIRLSSASAVCRNFEFQDQQVYNIALPEYERAQSLPSSMEVESRTQQHIGTQAEVYRTEQNRQF